MRCTPESQQRSTHHTFKVVAVCVTLRVVACAAVRVAVCAEKSLLLHLECRPIPISVSSNPDLSVVQSHLIIGLFCKRALQK